MQVGKYHNVFDSVVDIFKHKGISGFYVGYYSLILREIPFSII